MSIEQTRNLADQQLTQVVLTSFHGSTTERFREITETLVRHLHDFVEEVQLSEHGNLTFGQLQINSMPSGGFSLSSDPCSGQTLAPGASCAPRVVFGPPTMGAFAGSATIPDTASSGSSQSVSLIGSGVHSSSGGNPCSIQPNPPVTPPIQRPCADVRVSKAIAGVYLDADANETDGGLAKLFLGGVLDREFDNFVRSASWMVGEDVEFEVTVNNAGDDGASFALDVPPGFSYAGTLVPSVGRNSGFSLVNRDGITPSALGPGKAVTVVFRGRIRKEGQLTFTINASNVAPTDPVASNNLGSGTLVAGPRIAYRGVHYEAGQIIGTTYDAHQAADVEGVVSRRGAPVVIAVARLNGRGCQRLMDNRGHLDPKRPSNPCGRTIWLKTSAKGRTGWAFKLARLPPRGTYVVLVRQASQTLYELSPKLGNLFKLRLP